MSELDEFLAGDRPDDVVLFLSDAFLEADSALYDMGTETDEGVVLVVEGEKGRRAFQAGTGMEAMQFAKTAMGTDGEIAPDLSGGVCPAAEGADGAGHEAGTADAGPADRETETDDAVADHRTEFIFAFAEAENPEVGGLYAEGDVVHAYVACSCGATYSDKWVADPEFELDASAPAAGDGDAAE